MIHHRAICAAIIASCFAGSAHAKNDESQMDSARLVSLRAAVLSGFPETFTAFLEVHPGGRFRIEGFGGVMLGGDYTFGLRLKYGLYSGVSDSQHHVFDFGVGVGFRYLLNEIDTAGAPGEDRWKVNHHFGGEAAIHLMYTVWFVEHFGLDLQLHLGAGSLTEIDLLLGISWLPIFGLSAGFAI